jgi:hypothetical protein
VPEERWREQPKEMADVGAESMWDEVEREEEWCHEALSKLLDTTAKEITNCAHSMRWWNGEISHKRSQPGRVKRRMHRSAVTAQAMAEL